jgi:hypothetical protein
MTAALFVSVFANTMVNVAIPLSRNGLGVSEGVAGTRYGPAASPV